MSIRYYLAVFFFMISSVVYGPRVDFSDGSNEPTPGWAYIVVIIFWCWVFFVYMRENTETGKTGRVEATTKFEAEQEAERKAKLKITHQKDNALSEGFKLRSERAKSIKHYNLLTESDYNKFTKSRLYFYKFTQTKKGIVTSTQPIGTKLINGIEVPVREMSGSQSEVKFGFTAIKPELAAQMNVAVGDELPLEITDKPVLDGNGEAIPNLFWAH